MSFTLNVLLQNEEGNTKQSFIGYEANINSNIEVYCFYKISGEEQGTSVILEFKKTDRKIYQPKDVFNSGVYIGNGLAKEKVLDQFWTDNRDWLRKIR